jgi:hypothetical protein
MIATPRADGSRWSTVVSWSRLFTELDQLHMGVYRWGWLGGREGLLVGAVWCPD